MLPLPHCGQVDAPAALKVPAAQLVHVVRVSANLPAAHVLHCDMPVVAAKSPLPHVVQIVVTPVALNVPAAQSVHVMRPTAYFPAVQGVHCPAPLPLTDPSAHPYICPFVQ
jgi:hypothetical protein